MVKDFVGEEAIDWPVTTHLYYYGKSTSLQTLMVQNHNGSNPYSSKLQQFKIITMQLIAIQFITIQSIIHLQTLTSCKKTIPTHT